MKAVLDSLPPTARTKVYVIVLSITLIPLFYSINQSAPIFVEPGAILGLGSYLHPAYWVGLGLLVLCAIFAFMDTRLKNDAIFLGILFILGLYLAGIAALTEPTPRAPEAYHPAAVGEELLADGHLADPSEPYPLGSYRSWPATQLLSAALLATTNAELLTLIKYAPLLWAFLLILLSYSFGKRLGLSPNLCFALGFLALASWFGQQDFSPQSIAFLLYLVVLSLLVGSEISWQKRLLLLPAFGSLVLAHSLTPLAVVTGFALVLIYRRQTSLFLIFFVLWFAWYLYEAVPAFELGVRDIVTRPGYAISFLFRPEKMEGYQAPLALGRAFWRASQLSYAVLYGALLAAGGLLFLRKSLAGQQRRLVAFLFLWLAGVSLINLTTFVEGTTRTYLYGLVPVLAIILLTFQNRRVLIVAIMLIAIALNMPARYGAEASWSQVRASELAGGRFYAQEVNPEVDPTKTYFYNYAGFLMLYYNPDLITVSHLTANQIVRSLGTLSMAPLGQWVRYAILSKQARDAQLNAWGEDVFELWPQTPGGRAASLIYNSGYYRIYENSTPES